VINLADPFLDKLYRDGDVILFLWRNEFGWPLEYVSENVEKVLGYSEKDFYSTLLTYSDLIHPDDIDRVYEEVMDNSGSTDISFTHKPYRIRVKTGDYVEVFDSTVLVRGDSGEIQYYLGHIGILKE